MATKLFLMSESIFYSIQHARKFVSVNNIDAGVYNQSFEG